MLTAFWYGMVMLIKVGKGSLPEHYRSVALPARAKPRLDALFAEVEADQGKP